MIELTHGNLLTPDVEALVNTVNCVGFMGKGIALQFKQAFPANNAEYERACGAGEVIPGRMLIYETRRLINPRLIINFPTKRHWRARSRIEDIETGLRALIVDVKRLAIRSIAIPPLGCGLGGLDWRVVRPIIERAFEELPTVRVLLYEPLGGPAAKSMPVGTSKPKMTPARALFIKLMKLYSTLDYSLTLLEGQKLAYFLQEAGESLRLRYQAGHYGPYAANLNKVLEVMEGHYIRGYGDRQDPMAQLELLEGAVEQATEYLVGRNEAVQRLTRISELIEGFETPYGMELLASVHWVSTCGGREGEEPAENPDQATSLVHSWNPRKRSVFKADHVAVAWQRLEEQGWLPVSDGEHERLKRRQDELIREVKDFNGEQRLTRDEVYDREGMRQADIDGLSVQLTPCARS